MTLSYQWLKSLLPEPIEVNELATILTSIGLEVEHIETCGGVPGRLEGLVIGKILEANKLENSDRLQLCLVDIGNDEPSQIVCGAPNAAKGQTVVVATIGSTLYPRSGEPFTIKKSKIRGTESHGMICAEDEIGLGDSHDGIIVLDEEIKPGTPAIEYYQLPEADYKIEIGLTPNRMDAMSHIGVAKDICAYLANKHERPFIQVIPPAHIPQNSKGNNPIKVRIDKPESCKRYAGYTIQNITVAESPQWLKERLQAIGLKPINNIVDITNYILHECGQPLHAFDLDKIEGNEIIVNTYPDGTKFVCLDGKEISLTSEDLMISNTQGGMCLAGVFGGRDSGITEQTKNVFIESAWFHPKTIRRTSKHHELRTDSAIRFEKGVDISQCIYALQRAVGMIIEIAGGEIVGEMLDHYPTPLQHNEVKISYEYIQRLSGHHYAPEKIKRILEHLCFKIKSETTDGLELIVPYAKPDISIPADIVEEILRIDGLDQIAFTGKMNYSLPRANKNTAIQNARNKAMLFLADRGFFQIITNSITNSKYYGDDVQVVKMLNSLSSELDVLRKDLVDTGLQVIAHNINRKNTNLSLFELGKTYACYNGKYVEEETLALYCTGLVKDQDWNGGAIPADLYYLKGVIEQLLVLGGKKLSYKYKDQDITLLVDGKVIGKLNSIPAQKLKDADIKQAVYMATLKWEAVQQIFTDQRITFQPIPKFPFVKRDLSMLVAKSKNYFEIEQAIFNLKNPLIQSVQLFDLFEGEKIGKENKSIAISLNIQDAEKTLTDEEIDHLMSKVITALERDVNAVIRKA